MTPRRQGRGDDGTDDATGSDTADDGQASPRAPSRVRWAFRLVAAGLVVLVLYLAVTFVQVWAASRHDGRRTADAAVVLGAAQYDGRPSPALELRLAHALQLYEDGTVDSIVVTGGRQQGDRFTEATAGYNWLRDRGVPDEDILKEVQGHDTWESLRAVERFLAARDVEDVVLVSSPAHAKRLDLIADEVGLDAAVSPAGSGASVRSLGRETVAVAAGRLIGFRRLSNLVG